jgi:hypothetical protein
MRRLALRPDQMRPGAQDESSEAFLHALLVFSLPHLFKCAVPNIRRISDIEIERRSNESICGSERENIAFAQAIR